MNIQGYESIDEVIDRGKRALSPFEFEMIANSTNAILLDTRDAESFSKGFIPNSINIGIDGNFAVWVGTLIPDINQQLLLITEPGREEEVITRLARVGYDLPEIVQLMKETRGAATFEFHTFNTAAAALRVSAEAMGLSAKGG